MIFEIMQPMQVFAAWRIFGLSIWIIQTRFCQKRNEQRRNNGDFGRCTLVFKNALEMGDNWIDTMSQPSVRTLGAQWADKQITKKLRTAGDSLK
jgi:hypothetical protein